MHARLTLAASLALLVPLTPGAAQPAVPGPQLASSGAYRPDTRNPEGREVVAVFLSSSTCIANRDSTFQPAVRAMMRRLGQQRDSAGLRVSITGVSLDWSAREGVAYLDGFGTFDEVVAGRNWYNSAVSRHVWQAPGGRPTISQVVLLERTVANGERGVRITEERELARFVGGDQIAAWAQRGAPLPAVVPPRRSR